MNARWRVRLECRAIIAAVRVPEVTHVTVTVCHRRRWHRGACHA